MRQRYRWPLTQR